MPGGSPIFTPGVGECRVRPRCPIFHLKRALPVLLSATDFPPSAALQFTR